MKVYILLIIIYQLSKALQEQPNIVFILTDDQDVYLGGLTPMKNTNRLIAEEGVTFDNAFTTTPICCPSRSSILTGRYLHHHEVVNNSRSGGCSSTKWQKNWEPLSIGRTLQSAGYQTFYAGKYLNQYGVGKEESNRVPEGWHWWLGLVGNSVYYNYTLIINGTSKSYGDNPIDYLTDVLLDWSLQFLRFQNGKKPFFMFVSPPAPHEPFTPSDKYKGAFRHMKAPRTPNFNTGTKGKHWLIRNGKKHLPKNVIDQIDNAFRSRWETLLSVDDLVAGIIDRLEEAKLLDNTFVFFTSDHGFHLGQFAQVWDKRQPYETDLRVPFIVRGPGVPKNISKHDPTILLDIAPTFYEIAKIKDPPKSDGVSLLKKFQEESTKFSRNFFIEYRGEGGNGEPCFNDENVKLCSPQFSCKCFDARNNTYRCIRHLSDTQSSIYCAFRDNENFVERYDLYKDPYQLTNLEFKG